MLSDARLRKITMSTYDFEEKPKRSAAQQYELADVGTRLVAIIIDGFVLGLITGLLAIVFREPGAVGGFIVGVLYNGYFWTQNNGQTPGKRIMGIRVVRVDGQPIDFATAIIRYVGYYINTFVFGIGWLWALFNDKSQGWHDLLASTYVVRA
jgi:uncharacterized RDD family membrane protein YckC